MMILRHGRWQVQHSLPGSPISPLLHTPETFPEYVDHLPHWEHDLFAQLEIYFGCYTILELRVMEEYPVADTSASPDYTQCNLSSTLIIVGIMTFGWTMSLPNGTHIVSCSGHTPGSKYSSFHVKAYRMLSMVRFLFHLLVLLL
jgi:hypothetical protein